jgi:hypothetical protein
MAYTATKRCAYADPTISKAKIHEALGGEPVCGTRYANDGSWDWIPIPGDGEVTCGRCAIQQDENYVPADSRPRARRVKAPVARLTFFQKELAKSQAR